MTIAKKKRAPKRPKKLPSTYRGAKVLRGLGMKEKPFEALEAHALDGFDASADLWVVLEDRALESGHVEVKAFRDEGNAIRYARACACGNVDQRVLRVTAQTLVVATENEL